MENENTKSVIRFVGESNQRVIDSRDVAKMIGKTHKNLMRDIRNYISDFEPGSKLSPAEFFIESTYFDQNKQERPCYLLTKKGCEFVANKLTGRKGTIFTATYVGLFNQYQAEHNGKMIGTDKNLTRENLEFKLKWLAEMRKQNINKDHQLRNEDAKIWLELANVADDYGERRMATEMRNEAINTMTSLPVGGQREYTASEIANKLGVSAIQIGKWGNKLGIKRDQHLSYRTPEGAWRYFPEALKVFQDNALEIQDDDLGL
ncbi:phage regulatory protein [Limosilactobacillus fermentum]|uniref:Phage antirepressor n=1 Tax=Lactobacillus phage LF1 TaxID=947980 RepID=E9LUL6_9CAUD|nr:phage regulatory protein [Limosilactobacillus fermentum]YP_007003238.1 anti-repressor [Lactobacillus phage LF1]ADW01262.1 phage antirepressor [Lactobacillus phage LF1]UVW04141.1 phage regulatory protein [Limosilactobacillus fermentum]WEN04758.1 phage regulatory protein [Limosilactobacillus fermentum]WEN11613.1 phage regulatory protein [Limosilactobacillus fermentum]WJD38268.1 phage regulatory protein [Limosilactobacillus fermentum]